MAATRSPRAFRREWGGCARLLLAVLAVMPLGASANEEVEQAGQPIAAVFKMREVDFYYRSFKTFYPCHELRASVGAILRAVGARDDLKVNVTGCEDFLIPEETSRDRWGTFDDDDRFGSYGARDFGSASRRGEREQLSHIRVRLMTPIAVTPEVLAEMDRDRSRRELVSRVTGDPAAMMNDPIVFAAQRQEITLSRKLIRLEPKDCELLEQMTRTVFRELDVRVTRRNFSCASSSTRITPQLTAEALLPVGMFQPVPATTPGAAGSSRDESAHEAPVASEPVVGAEPAATPPPEMPTDTERGPE